MARNRSESIKELYENRPDIVLSPTSNSSSSFLSSQTTTNSNLISNDLISNNVNIIREEAIETGGDSAYSMKTIVQSPIHTRKNSEDSNFSSSASSSISSSSNSFDSLRPTSPPPSSQPTPRSSFSIKRNVLPLFNLTPASPRNSFSHHNRSSISNSNSNSNSAILSSSPYLTTLSSSSTSSTILHLGGEDSTLTQRSNSYLNNLEESKPILYLSLKIGLLFLIVLIMIYGLLNILLPKIELKDWEKIKIPKSFEDLKGLNEVLQIYKAQHYYRVLSSYIIIYLFIQCFSIPGSMYMSIVAGSLYGVVLGVPLVCFCVASGALLCYLLSQQLGPTVLLKSSKWRERVENWKGKIGKHEKDLISYLIILRISPLPPHWIVNLLSPHLGISIYNFWISTFFGIGAVTFIHTQIGTTLDQMSSSDDFKLISVKNILGLCGVILAVLIPVILRSKYKSDLDDPTAEDDDDLTPTTEDEDNEISDEEEEEEGRDYSRDDDDSFDSYSVAESGGGISSFEVGTRRRRDEEESLIGR